MLMQSKCIKCVKKFRRQATWAKAKCSVQQNLQTFHIDWRHFWNQGHCSIGVFSPCVFVTSFSICPHLRNLWIVLGIVFRRFWGRSQNENRKMEKMKFWFSKCFIWLCDFWTTINDFLKSIFTNQIIVFIFWTPPKSPENKSQVSNDRTIRSWRHKYTGENTI